MKKWSSDVKSKARELRTSGLSYGNISKQLKVSKSTLHGWIFDLKQSNFDREAHLKEIRKLAVEANSKKRETRLTNIRVRVANQVSTYPFEDDKYIKSLASVLYWAEGAKSRGSIIFANTDPKLSLLFITLLRKGYSVDESKFRIRLHLHSYHNVNKTKKFWSDLLQVPLEKFEKIYIRPRSLTKKFRENFAGICFIKYHSEDLRYEILETASQIQSFMSS